MQFKCLNVSLFAGLDNYENWLLVLGFRHATQVACNKLFGFLSGEQTFLVVSGKFLIIPHTHTHPAANWQLWNGEDPTWLLCHSNITCPWTHPVHLWERLSHSASSILLWWTGMKTDSGLKWSQNSSCAISKQSFLVVAVDFYTLSLHKRCLQRLHWWGVNGRAEKPSIYRLLCIDLHHIQSHINFYCSTNTTLWEVECIKSRNPAIDKSVHLE